MSVEKYKVVLVGESGVGKTSIINRFSKDMFEPHCSTSIGSSFSSKLIFIKEKQSFVKFEVWDTAGQEKYRSLAKVFFKNAKIILLVYDITNKKSFEEIKSYWYEQVTDHCEPNIVLGVAANKSDLIQNKEVTENEGNEFAKSINAFFANTSARNNKGIDELFQQFGTNMLNIEKELLSNSQKEKKVAIDADKTKKQTSEDCSC